MFGLQPVVYLSQFSHRAIWWKAVKATPRWELARVKNRERKRERALSIPQRSINTLKALNPKSITITVPWVKNLPAAVSQDYQTLRHWMSEERRPCLEFHHQFKRQKLRYIAGYWLVACRGYTAVTRDRVKKTVSVAVGLCESFPWWRDCKFRKAFQWFIFMIVKGVKCAKCYHCVAVQP